MTSATQPSIEDVVLGSMPWIPKVRLDNPFLAMENGDDFLEHFRLAADSDLAPFILVVEGSIPDENNKQEGYWASFGVRIRKRFSPLLRANGSIDWRPVFVVSPVSSPGSGKTMFLEKTLTLLRQNYRVAALVGDLATENDAVRLARSQAPVKQITTGTLCHLEAAMVQNALEEWHLNQLDFLFIENVGTWYVLRPTIWVRIFGLCFFR
jgi:hypothetical protein